jgi:3-oxoacyl-[acyl-carrier-protein] synthase-3
VKNQPSPQWREIVERCVRSELASGAQLPADNEDLIECGAVDSMAWVSVVRGIEAATGVDDFGDRMFDQPRSIHVMLKLLEATTPKEHKSSHVRPQRGSQVAAATAIVGWGAAVGERRVAAAELEREFHLKPGKISKGAGIESVARVAQGEDEVTLAMRSAEAALAAAGAGIGDVDCILATTETLTGYPSLGARLHAQLLADAHCAVLDVGGACLGMVNGLAVAQQFIAAGRFRSILLVTADVHSRMLTRERVKGEFGALFGDGSSALLLRAQDEKHNGAKSAYYRVEEVQLGCDVAAAAAIRIGLNNANEVDLTFEGESLSRAAVGKLEKLVADLELRHSLRREDALAFATHQPNPRLVTVLARQLRVPKDKFPPVALTCGNLGSSTCGVALVRALTSAAHGPQGPIFVAALGPGLLFGSSVLR